MNQLIMITSPHFELLVATSNSGKTSEIQEGLDGLPLKVRSLKEFPAVSPVEEVGRTYKENAIGKALGYSKQTGLYALADDSGLEVDALEGRPGILSARFGGPDTSDRERRQKLLFALSQQPDSKRTARFVCVMALAGVPLNEEQSPDVGTRLLIVTEGKCEGVIAHEARGANGFGYDPVFIPTGHELTFGELPSEVKRMISHRARAVAAMREFLQRSLVQT